MPHARVPIVPLPDRRAFSPAEVAAVTGFSLSFIYEQIKSGALRSRKIAGRRIITSEAFAELLGEASGNEVPTTGITSEQLDTCPAAASCERPAALSATAPDRRGAGRNARTDGEVRYPSRTSAVGVLPSLVRERGGAR